MVTLARELRMDHHSFSAARLQRNLCGPYLSEETESGHVRCYLQIARTRIPVDVPADVLAGHRLLGNKDAIVLRLPGEAAVRVNATPILTEKQQTAADRWIAEMEDFDRF